jgi:catechol 2,3-dioxygenase-like lactoylglutathione lyase family enzyme
MDDMQFELSLLKIPVSDIARSALFYRESLGFKEEFVAEEYGWAQLQAGDVPLALYRPGMGGGDGKIGGSLGFHLSLPSAAFDSLAPTLKDSGVLAENMIHKGADGSVFIEVSDPDDNLLKIMRADAAV